MRHFIQPEALCPSSNWTCSHCMERQPALKQMSIRRLPPVLCVHLKRFEHAGGPGVGGRGRAGSASHGARYPRKLHTRLSFPLDQLDLEPFVSASVLRERYKCRRPITPQDQQQQQHAAQGLTTGGPGGSGTATQAAYAGRDYTPTAAVPGLKLEDRQGVGEEGAGRTGGGAGLGSSSCAYTLFAVVVHKGDMQGGHYIAYIRSGGSWYHCDDAWVTLVEEQEVADCQAYMLFYEQGALASHEQG